MRVDRDEEREKAVVAALIDFIEYAKGGRAGGDKGVGNMREWSRQEGWVGERWENGETRRVYMGTAAEEGSGQKRGVTMEGSDGQRGQRDVPPGEEAAMDEGQWVRSVAWGRKEMFRDGMSQMDAMNSD